VCANKSKQCHGIRLGISGIVVGKFS
jgi:hypothetical protein